MTAPGRLARRKQLEQMRHLAQEALIQYGMEDAWISLLRSSQFFNTSFDIRAPDGRRYVLRVQRPSKHPERRHIRIESELWWLNRVREDLRLTVPEPVQTLDGENLVSVVAEDGVPRFCVLFGYVPGRFLQRGLRPRHLEQVGTLTARLHTYSEQLTVPDWFERPVVDRVDEEFEESVAGRFREGWSVEAAETIAAALQRVREVQKELGRSSATFGVIHADIHHWNYLFHAGRIRLIDFDDFGWGHYLYDLAVTTQQINRLPRGPELWRALLDGYRRARALSPEHEAMVESFRMLREIQDMNFDLALCDDPTQARIPLVMAELQRFLESHC